MVLAEFGSGNQLQLDFVSQGPYSKNIGSCTYLMKDDCAYELFQLKNKEFTYTVDDSQLDRGEGTDCGNNGDDTFKGVCDKNGCDIQTHRLGVHNFFGPGSDFQIDSTKPVQVTTRFITDDGSDHGKHVEVKQFYTQDGKTIEHPTYNVDGNYHNTITDDFCNDWVATT